MTFRNIISKELKIKR